MTINYGENAKCLGYDMLFILLWVGVWNSTDIIVHHYVNRHKQLFVYLTLSALMVLVLIFVNRGCGGSVTE